MKTTKKALFGTSTAILLALLSSPALRADDYKIQLIADNDFALFVGTETSITRVLYQNSAGWPDQITAADSFSISFQGNENTVYLLAMGMGGEENISGLINGKNIVTLFEENSASILVSSNVAPYLTGYEAMTGSTATTLYNAQLVDVQDALPDLIWSSPTVNTTQIVIGLNPVADDKGFTFSDNNAVFYKISAQTLEIPAVPEPSAMLLLGAGALMTLGLRRVRRLA